MAEQVVAPGVAPSQSATKNRWLTVTVLSTLQLIENSEGGLINSLFPVIRADLGLTLTSLGILTSIGKFARMIFGPIWAILGDRFGRKLILVLTALWGVWMVAAGFAQNFNQLVLLYGIGVLGTVAAEPISNGLVSDIFKPNERGKVYGTMPTLSPDNLVAGDVPITTDYRQPLAEVVSRRLKNDKLTEVFPGFSPGEALGVA